MQCSWARNMARAISVNGKLVNVEYVSANPTGPMHVGHGRGAVFGDALANLLAFVGFKVTREYYVNDAGAQVDVLARSAYLRYREALGEDIGTIPEGLYPGDYLKPVGAAMAAQYGDALRHKPESEWIEPARELAVAMMRRMIRGDLSALHIRHNKFFSERSLISGPRLVKSWPPELVQAVTDARRNYPGWGKSRLGPLVRSSGFTTSDTTVGQYQRLDRPR